MPPAANRWSGFSECLGQGGFTLRSEWGAKPSLARLAAQLAPGISPQDPKASS